MASRKPQEVPMTKPKSKTKVATPSAAPKARKNKSRTRSAAPASNPAGRHAPLTRSSGRIGGANVQNSPGAVHREWLRFYDPEEKPELFDQILQSWDTANKDTELSNFSVCTTWGIKDQHLFLLDVFRHRMDFPTLKRSVTELAAIHRADIVLVEDKASGTSLIAELRSQNFSAVQEAPSIDGDKVMRLRVKPQRSQEDLHCSRKRLTGWTPTFLSF
jgi:hypothetical protein